MLLVKVWLNSMNKYWSSSSLSAILVMQSVALLVMQSILHVSGADSGAAWLCVFSDFLVFYLFSIGPPLYRCVFHRTICTSCTTLVFINIFVVFSIAPLIDSNFSECVYQACFNFSECIKSYLLLIYTKQHVRIYSI